MITKGIVSQLVDDYTVKVRLPRLDRIENTSIKTTSQNLREAIMCTPPNCRPNLQLGDIVFVEVDDLNEDEAIILGQLYCENKSSTYSDFILGELMVQNRASLPKITSIGEVTSTDISYLKGTHSNIQYQINSLRDQISALKSDLNITIEQLNLLQNNTGTSSGGDIN